VLGDAWKEVSTLTVQGTAIAISIDALVTDLDLEELEKLNAHHIAEIEEGVRQAERGELIDHETVVAQVRWQGCDEVEVIEGKVSGVHILIGTRMQADGVVECFVAGRTVEEIADDFDLDIAQVRKVIEYAKQHGLHNP
jgi:uncharacterized protein (DUF433 family)